MIEQCGGENVLSVTDRMAPAYMLVDTSESYRKNW